MTRRTLLESAEYAAGQAELAREWRRDESAIAGKETMTMDAEIERAEYDAKRFGDALTWLEHNLPNGVQIVARALSEGRENRSSEVPPSVLDWRETGTELWDAEMPNGDLFSVYPMPPETQPDGRVRWEWCATRGDGKSYDLPADAKAAAERDAAKR